jgi:hypothetical protein
MNLVDQYYLIDLRFNHMYIEELHDVVYLVTKKI